MDDTLLVMPLSYSKFLFYSSFSMLLSAIISIIVNDLYVTIYFFLLFLTSINYWRRPEYGLRRNIDLFVVKCGIIIVFYQFCLLKNEFCRFVFLSLSFCSTIFFIIEHILVYFNSLKWIIFHMTIHLYMSLSALFVIFN
jgi:hypothetical protein